MIMTDVKSSIIIKILRYGRLGRQDVSSYHKLLRYDRYEAAYYKVQNPYIIEKFNKVS